MVTFTSKEGSAPFPRSADDWKLKVNPVTGVNFTQKEAEHKVAQDVFGHDYTTDRSGNPIEKGKGSAHQQTAQHQQALMIAQDAEISRKLRMGWHPGLENAFNPKQPRKKQAKKKTASAPAEGTA